MHTYIHANNRLHVSADDLRDPLVVCGELLRAGAPTNIFPCGHPNAHSQERLLQVHGD